jgi:hypothetical protein
VALTAAVALTSTSLTAPELAPWMPKRALYRYVREIKDETTATRNILNCVRRTAHALDHAALTSFEHERAHYGAHISPFVPILSVDAQRRTERVSTLVATEYEERRTDDQRRTERVSTLVATEYLERRTERISTDFGRGQVRGAPCTERISTLVAAEYAEHGLGGAGAEHGAEH